MARPTPAGLSRMTFEAREEIDMWGDVVQSRSGRTDLQLRRLRDQIDAFRAEQGWSPHGFGHEGDQPVVLVPLEDLRDLVGEHCDSHAEPVQSCSTCTLSALVRRG